MLKEVFFKFLEILRQLLLICHFMANQEGWCDSQGILEEVRAKLHMRQEGAIKRERAIAYALSHQVVYFVFYV